MTGLAGKGLVLANGADTVSVSANGTFAFPAKVAKGQAFSVTVKTQPTDPSQACTVSGGSGTVVSGDVTTVVVNCATNKFTVGGNVSGLAGVGLVLQNNGGDDATIAADGAFAFGTSLADGSNYAVTVKTQPAGQICTVANGAGKLAGANAANVAVTCKTTYTVGGNVTGLVGMGLVLTNNGGDDITRDVNGTFSFPTKIASGSNYVVAIKTQPNTPDQTCSVVDASGTVANADVASVVVKCASQMCSTPNEGGTATITCPEGAVVKSIDFASYGTPTGSCGAFAESTCSAATSQAVVEAACLGKTTCTVNASNGVFGDPCVGTFKRLYVQATCE